MDFLNNNIILREITFCGQPKNPDDLTEKL